MSRARVSIKGLEDYADDDKVVGAVRACLEPLGGMGAFVKPGQKVLLKVNIVTPLAPERAATTHPAMVRAVARLALEAGGRVSVGDSPGIGDPAKVLETCGIAAVMRELKLELADFRNTATFECAENRVAKRLDLAKAAADADVIITIPKPKTHMQMTYTGAVKNQFGLIPGTRKAQYHYRLETREWLAMLMVDINRMARPALCIMDAVYGMDGEGPSSGNPRKIAAVLASSDLPAMDAVCCAIIGQDPEQVPTQAACRESGFGTTELEDIEVLGDDWKKFRLRDFELVKRVSSVPFLPLPKAAHKWIREQLSPRPRIINDKCILCMACFKGCPVEPSAIDPRREAARQVNDKTCIRCYCCHEFCPEKAIRLRKSWLDRIFRLSALIGR